MKYLLVTLSLASSLAFAEGPKDPPPHGEGHPPFTEEQRACLERTLGKPGEGNRPSHEAMQKASKKCGIELSPQGQDDAKPKRPE